MDAATPDLTTMPDDELAALATTSTAELARRQALAGTERRIDDMCLDYLRAEGRINGAPWQAPSGFMGAYPKGWRVTHDGAVFEAAVPGASTTPPGDEWVEANPGDPLVDFWEDRSYKEGEQARDVGLVFTATSTVNGARPSDYPGGWNVS